MRIVAFGDQDPNSLPHREVDAALELFPDDVERAWVATDSAEARELVSVDGVWLLPGTPYRDDAAASAAVRYCLITGTPFLGTSGGFQWACVELARRLAGIEKAAHAETDPDADQLVVQRLGSPLHGEVRIVAPLPDTRLASICGSATFAGFHRCGYGLAKRFAERLAEAGVVISAVGDEVGVESIEMPGHPFFLATAFQPQVGTSARRHLHPLIKAFILSAHQRAAWRQAESEHIRRAHGHVPTRRRRRA